MLREGLINFSRGLLSSHGATYLCLSFLQQYGVIPVLTDEDHIPEFLDDSDIDTWFDAHSPWESTNNMSLGQLVIYFFYYAGVAFPAVTNASAHMRTGVMQERNHHVLLYSIKDSFGDRETNEMLRESY
jgi:hypothetical protein